MRDPKSLVQGDMFLHRKSLAIVKADTYNIQTEKVMLEDGSLVSPDDLIDIESPGYLREVIAEINMLRRELRAATGASVVINNCQYMCSVNMASHVKRALDTAERADANNRSLQHRIDAMTRDIDKARGLAAVQLERIGRLRGTIDGAIFALKEGNTLAALSVLEAGAAV